MKIYTYQGKKNVSGEKIRQMRNMKRMSQSALAAKMQVEGVMLERDSISRIEGGERFVADYELRENGVKSNNIGLNGRNLCKLLDIYVGNCYSIKKKRWPGSPAEGKRSRIRR